MVKSAKYNLRFGQKSEIEPKSWSEIRHKINTVCTIVYGQNFDG